MQAHIVLTHPEPLSFNAHLAEIARRTLEAKGWQVTMCDLYTMGFDPLEGPRHYVSRSLPERFDAQAEQRHASGQGTIPADVAAEIAKPEAADLLILQYPMWWHPPPAMLKGWIDRSCTAPSTRAGSGSRPVASSASAPCCR
jgi:NAD(P)H dehydrogenase (quinone)